MSPKLDSDTPLTEECSICTFDLDRPFTEIKVVVNDIESLSSEERSHISHLEDPEDFVDGISVSNISFLSDTSEVSSFPSEFDNESIRSTSTSKLSSNRNSSNTFKLYNIDISRLSRTYQFLICASSLFFFTLGYSYQQELISIHILDRKMPLFLATIQFGGYSLWSYILYTKEAPVKKSVKADSIPLSSYILLSSLRALEFALSNLSMQFLNYPAKTLMKSSRVVFTMMIGVVIAKKRYSTIDYFNVMILVTGLIIFLHADVSSNAQFHPFGIALLSAALICDGIVNNKTEILMNKYSVGQDEFLFRIYSISFVIMAMIALIKGELGRGIVFLFTPGKLGEIEKGLYPTWSPLSKQIIFISFSFMGLLGSSSAAAITKNFGALTYSITSTTRKATTIFMSFLLFESNNFTHEHGTGMLLFSVSLITKAFRASSRSESMGKAASKSSDRNKKFSRRRRRPSLYQIITKKTRRKRRLKPSMSQSTLEFIRIASKYDKLEKDQTISAEVMMHI